MKFALSLCVALASMLSAQAASAQAAISSSLTAQLIESDAGKTVLKPASVSKPGDVIAYTGLYRNSGVSAASKLAATIPVPVGTTLVAGSAEPARAQASTDGLKFADMPLMRMVKLADGTSRNEAVPLAEYRALRWEIGVLAPAATSSVALRVRVDTPDAATPAKASPVAAIKAPSVP